MNVNVEEVMGKTPIKLGNMKPNDELAELVKSRVAVTQSTPDTHFQPASRGGTIQRVQTHGLLH